MIIKELEIISFGKFKNKTINFSEGLNIVFGNNESGKSTIISFIYAMLYGFGDNRGKTLPLREKFTPWSGGACEGKLTVQTDDGKSVSIYRKAGNAKKYDTLRVYDTDTGDEILASPEEIVGVNSDTFFKTLCIRQLSSVFDKSNDEIIQKLSNISSGGDENTSYEKAQKLLENVRREIQPYRGKGGEMPDLLQQIAVCEKDRNTQLSLKSELKSVLSLIPSAEKAVNELKSEYEKCSDVDYNSSISHILGRLEEIKKSHTFSLFSGSVILGGITLLLGIIALLIRKEFSYILLPFAIICFVYSLIKSKSSKRDDIAALEKELQKLSTEKNQFDEKLSDLRERLFASQAKLNQLTVREQTLRLSISEESDNLEQLYEKKRFLEKKLHTVKLASEALKSAHEKMQKNFTPALNKRASYYFSIISSEKYKRIFCDEEFGIQVESDIPRESGFFSGGTVDQLYLSLRLALIDMLFEEKSCPMILDQPFLQYDEPRKKKTVELLENLGKNRQILLFTSDKNVNSSNKPTEILT